STRIYRRQSRPSLPRRFTATKAQRPALLRCVTIRIAAAFVQLRGLVQHVLSTLRPSGIISELDCFQALGIKHYTFGVCDAAETERKYCAAPLPGRTTIIHRRTNHGHSPCCRGDTAAAWHRKDRSTDRQHVSQSATSGSTVARSDRCATLATPQRHRCLGRQWCRSRREHRARRWPAVFLLRRRGDRSQS